MSGWIKIHRRMTQWEWYTEPNVFRVFFHLVLTANHKDKKWRGTEVKKGQLITSHAKLAAELDLSFQEIRTALDKLEETEEITRTATNKFTLVTIEKYALYQGETQDSNKQANKQATNKQQTKKGLKPAKSGIAEKSATNKQQAGSPEKYTSKADKDADSNKRTTNEQQTNNKQATTNKNVKNVKNKKNNTSKTFPADSIEYKLTEKIAKTVKENSEYAKIPDDLNKWAIHIDRLIRIDNAKVEDIKKTIEFIKGHSFWSPNILSTAKFREKFPTLHAQANRKNNYSDKPKDAFSDFEQRTSKYTPEELDKIARRKFNSKYGG